MLFVGKADPTESVTAIRSVAGKTAHNKMIKGGCTMRVITGSVRGRRLKAPPGLAVRPTTDLVKEAVFSIIHFDLESARVLDLFAGSGQMGIEALSRGAKYCVFVDSSRESQAAIRDNLATTELTDRASLAPMDAKTYLQASGEKFDIAFLDPPYDSNMIPSVLPLLAEKMSESGIILCEHQKGETLPEQVGEFAVHKAYRYGKTVVTVYRRQDT